MRPGPRNSITDVAGLAVGNAEDRTLLTGVTAVIPATPAVAAIDVRGGGPGTRESDALGPLGTVEVVHGIALSGGSAYGLDAAGGVMDWLRSQARGFAVGDARVPIVPGAIIFDLATGGPKSWETPPWWRLGRAAAEAAAADFALGNAGAGLGARAGGLKGGLGTASFVADGVTVGALAVANPLGSVVMPGTRAPWAWWLEQAGEWGGVTPPSGAPSTLEHAFSGGARANTTLAVVATDARLTRAEAGRIATMAHDGFARAIRPVHAPLDGDTVFVLATGSAGPPGDLAALSRLGMLAADCVARAITRGVVEAEPLAGLPAWRNLPG
ncbi:P1 family peptidase [Limibaculum sp. M0105]|uniref:P1 family peptidase n=1 Tax=Thermohalobaculum xanthum TaxID=2753746 RepID=A0A8J7M5Q2_9RHOB|nr:P1 family peptidase [Thermohalobaculum xanthum]